MPELTTTHFSVRESDFSGLSNFSDLASLASNFSVLESLEAKPLIGNILAEPLIVPEGCPFAEYFDVAELTSISD